MPKAELEEVLDVSRDQLFEAIVNYEDYPDFVEGVRSVEVERKGPGKCRATYHLSLFKDFEYILDHEEDKDSGKVSWSLVESDLFKKNEGSWTLESEGDDQTRAFYELDVEFKIPVPGFIVKKLVKGNLPRMMKSFEERAGG